MPHDVVLNLFVVLFRLTLLTIFPFLFMYWVNKLVTR